MRDTISNKYHEDLISVIDGTGNKLNIKENIHSELLAILLDNPETVPEYGIEKLVDLFYEDIVGLAFLEDLLLDPEIEEINANAWDDIEVLYRNGEMKKGVYKFLSPDQALSIVQKIARIGSSTLNESTPRIDGYISTGVRFSALIPPIVDRDIGVTFSIRKQSENIFSKEDLIKFETITEEAFDFLKLCFENKISVICGGATSSGKTALLQALLKEISEKGLLRIFTIEEDTRELNLVYKVSDETKSRVIHTKTRPSDVRSLSISTKELLKDALRFHPDIILPAEIRGEEAMTAQEAGRTGHGVGTSIHISSAKSAPERIMTMCQMGKTSLDKNALMKLITEAFPIIAFQKQLPDKTRKVMEIYEVEGYDILSGEVIGRTLFRYTVSDNIVDDQGMTTKTIGKHERVSSISNTLKIKLLENGARAKDVKLYEQEISL